MHETYRDSAQFRQSDLLDGAGFRHAFFTRRGGVSDGPYASLNFSIGVGDAPERVSENLHRAAAALSISRPAMYFLSQVHGVGCVVIDGTEDHDEVLRREGDAVLSARAGVACGVRIADCVPILVGDRESGAVAAIHAGWRGAVGGIVPKAVERLRALVGREGRLLAAIGPHIRVEAFEVGDDVAAAVAAVCPDPDAVVRSFGERPHVDLCRVIQYQLASVGVEGDSVDVVPGCTASDPDLFSYRRDGQKSGRHLAAIVARARR